MPSTLRTTLQALLLGLFLAFAGLGSSAALAAVDVNTASASELQSLPGIGPAKAAAIVDHRTQNGPFATVEQLDDVTGIGPATLANLRALVTIGDAPAAEGAAPADPAAADDAPAAAPTAPSAGALDINTASASALQSLPGIGPAKAAAIVEDRSQNGPYSSCDALSRVNGIGSATVAGLRDQCTASPAAQ